MIPQIDQQTIHCDTGVSMTADIGGDPNSPTVLLLHGGGQTRHAWRGAMEALLGEGYRVINLDSRGHGDSEWAQDSDYRATARSRDLQTLLDQLTVPYAMVGASMGGMTALHSACLNEPLINSGLLRALALVDIVPRPTIAGVAHIKAFMERHLDGFEHIDQAIDAVTSYNPRRRPPTPDGILKNLRQHQNGRYYWHGDPALLAVTSEEEGDEIYNRLNNARHVQQLPTLLVRGLQSDVIDEPSIEEFRQTMNNLAQVDVAGAGHMVVGDKNDAFNKAILEFLHQHLNMPA